MSVNDDAPSDATADGPAARASDSAATRAGVDSYPNGAEVPDSLPRRVPDDGDSRSEQGLRSAPLDAGTAAELLVMSEAIERFHGRAEHYESIIRRMQSRIEELQGDQVRELLKPVILKLASLHTDASAAEERASAREDDSARKDFDYFVSEIEETLGLLDVESIGVTVVDGFDASKHAARRRIDTDDPSLDRRIAKVLRQGFSFVGAERAFVPAMVSVYRYVSPELAENE